MFERILEMPYKNKVMHCRLGGPLKALLTLCSSSQITNPMMKKNAPVIHHIPMVKGLTKTQVLDFVLFMGAKITRPVQM